MTDTEFEKITYRKVTRRLLPILFLCFVASYLDRVNVGFAKLQMLADLGFSETVYGLGAGIFFIGYFLFEVPSNIILHRVGARLWIARIMVSWGIISAAMIFVNTPASFYAMRFLLGVAEAGFFPGVILYLTYWYPARRRGKITAMFMTAVAVSGIVGGPLSGWIMNTMPGVAGLAGWQWMFLIEAIPSLILGGVVFLFLDNGISDADWLCPTGKQLLTDLVREDNLHKPESGFRDVVRSRVVWHMALIYFCFVMGLYGVSFWLPTIIKSTGVSNTLNIGLLTAVPYLAAAVTMVLIGHSADKHQERRWHIILPAMAGCTGLLLCTAFAHNTTWAMISLTLATMGVLTTFPLFWSLPTAILRGRAAAGGIALINSLGNLAGFVSPYSVGWLKQLTHSTDTGMVMMAASMTLGALLTFMVPEN